MTDTERAEIRERLKQVIATRGFVWASEDQPIAQKSSRQTASQWLLDIRAIALSPAVLDDITRIFWDTYRTQAAVQIGGMETAAIPLITAVVINGARDGRDVSGFYLRKSRKKQGLMHMIEGEVRPGKPVILIDDLVNAGSSLRKQVDVLEELGEKVTDIWTLVRFRNLEAYEYFTKKGIRVQSLFELDDFGSIGVRNLSHTHAPVTPSPYEIKWKFSSGSPSHQLVVAKSDPAIDDIRVYVGSDRGILWALNQSDGTVVWKHQIGFHPKGKGIFSSPVVYDGTVYFGGYDGNVYALDAATGAKKWMSLEADWVGSSPAIAPEIDRLFIGLEFGLWRRRGGIAAIDMDTGATRWHYTDMPCYTHSTPRYISEHRQVAIGSNDGCVYLFDAETGALQWKTSTGPITPAEVNSGFSAHDLKEAVAYDAQRDLIVAANMSGGIFMIDRLAGEIRSEFRAEFGSYGTPLIHDGRVYVSSLDKNLYCIDLENFKEMWRWNGGARIFASPTLIEDSIYIGANTGRLTELDPATGKERSILHLTERITNRPVYNPNTKRLFVPTFANEIYCVERSAETDENPH